MLGPAGPCARCSLEGPPRELTICTFPRGKVKGVLEKLGNHAAMVSLYFMYYDFGRVHQNASRNASNGGGTR